MRKEVLYGKYLYVYADIFFIKGYGRTLICDIKTEMWQYISNKFYDIILLLRKYTIDVAEQRSQNYVDKDQFYSFVKLLLDNHCATIVDDISLFPQIKKVWDSPFFIENSLIDTDEVSNHDYEKIASQLQDLLCRHIELRFFCECTLDSIRNIIESFINRDFGSITLLLKYTSTIKTEDYLDLGKTYPSISFVIHSSPQNSFFESKLKNIYPVVGYVQYIKQILSSENCCGIINKENFVYPHMPKDFIEGVVRNRCLNRKISIAKNGDIKNCPAMKNCYGNIRNTSLLDVYKNKKYRSYWYIIKDRISVCKDCEYRYVCNDCRAFVKRKLDKPIKCSYDPYTMTWAKE